jgi:hypothetical protein
MRKALQAIGVLLLAAIGAGLSLREGMAPEPAPRDAPAAEFSAARAMDVLGRILGDQQPHPLGSDANRAVRDRIVAEFERIGLAVSVRSRFTCGARACATVDNVLARLPGTSPDDAILLTAHYDSVAAGPGAGDDGAGVAAMIETARALAAGPGLQRDVLFLADDGEEAGLLGAVAFTGEPEFARVGWVLNLEARGDVGASSLIETQAGNAGVVAAIGRSLPRPSGSSLDYEIYKTLPNDTDFTVYREHGRGGANFALSRGAARYHTPRDDIARLSPGSVQHHGDNAFALVREFAATHASALRADHDAVFLHPFSMFQLSWPVRWNALLLALAALGWVALAWRLHHGAALRLRQLLFASTAVTLGSLLLTPLAGWALSWALAASGTTPAQWTAQGPQLAAAFALLGIAVAWMFALPLQRRLGLAALGLATLLPLLLLATLATAWMPGASFLGVLPVLAALAAAHLWPARVNLWSAMCAVPVAILWTPYAFGAYDAIGRDGLVGGTWLAGIIGMSLLPAVATLGRGARAATGIALLALAGCVAVAVARPAFDADTPRPLNLLYAGEDGQPAQLLASPLAEAPQAFLRGNGFATSTEPAFPFSRRGYHPGPRGGVLAAPTLEVLADETRGNLRHLRLQMRPAHAGDEVTVHLPEAVMQASVRVQGVPLAASRWPWSRQVASIATPAEGVTLEFEAPPGQPLELVLTGESTGLPAEFAAVARARDAIASQIHGGDRTIAWRRIVLPR